MKNWFKIVFLMVIVVSFSSTSYAATSRYGDAAQDMLQSDDGNDSENENVDSASRWGTSANRVRAQSIVKARVQDSIEESSFEVEKNRAPASMRGPAASKSQERPKQLPSAKTMIRTLQNKKAYQEAAVIVNDLGFFPSTLFVTQGVPVRLFVTGASQRSQCMILDAFGIRRQIRNQKVEEVTFTPDQVGKFSFTCPMNGAKGTVIVRELEINNRLPASEEEPVQTSLNTRKEMPEPSDSAINDSDFGVEFRLK